MNKHILLTAGLVVIAFTNIAFAADSNLALAATAEVRQSKHSSGAAKMNDGSYHTFWRSNPLYNQESVQISLKWASIRKMNSIEIQWPGADYARLITVRTHDGNNWTNQGTVYGNGTKTFIKLIDGTATNYIWIDLANSNSSYFSIKEITVQ